MGGEDEVDMKLPMNVILFYAGTIFVLVIFCSMICFKCCNSHFCKKPFPDPATIKQQRLEQLDYNSSFRLSSVYPNYV